MKKIGILTFHRAENYGAFWQAYALQETINKINNVKSFIIDYRSEEIKKRNALLSGENGFDLKKAVKDFAVIFSSVKRKRSFEKARKRNYKIEVSDIKKNELAVKLKGYNAFIVGSDQVWNREIIKEDNSFFLDFVSKPTKKFSYAASIGSSTLSETQLDYISKQIEDFSRVAIREPDLIQPLQRKSNHKIECTIDPVFLLSGEEWRKHIPNYQKKKYILFFMMGIGKSALPAINFAKELAREKGLELIYLSDKERWYKFRDMKHYGTASPEEFIGLIENAEFVVTNSFHATAFSIILHTPFYVEVSVKRPERITNLLHTFDIEQCALKNGKPECRGEINWEQIEQKIKSERDFAFRYLNELTEML